MHKERPDYRKITIVEQISLDVAPSSNILDRIRSKPTAGLITLLSHK